MFDDNQINNKKQTTFCKRCLKDIKITHLKRHCYSKAHLKNVKRHIDEFNKLPFRC